MSSIVVTLKYDPHWQALEWAKINCKSYITNDVCGRAWDNYIVSYYFSNKEDALVFKLMWDKKIYLKD